MEVELANVQSCLENVTPTIEGNSQRIEELEKFKNNTDGKFTVIVWLVGVNITLLITLLAVLLGWGLSHLALRVSADSPTVSEIQNAFH